MYSGSKQDNGDGEWVPVDPVAGALTINIGDMIQVAYILLVPLLPTATSIVGSEVMYPNAVTTLPHVQ